MKKIATALLSCALAAATLAGCAANAAQVPQESQEPHTAALTATAAASVKSPKYVFLFIGDGMSYPQIQSTSDYLGALKDADYWQAQPSLDDNGGAILDGPEYLNFMNFEAAGSAVTYDSNSFAPDSASTATSISTGYKTYSGSINVDETGTISYETIAEQLHAQKGYSVGVITSVNLNHATPAAFYAHQASRNDYYDIGLELIDSGFEYFAGGGLLKPTGAEGDQADLYALAEKAGYHVVKTQAEAEQVTGGPVVIIDEHLADSDAMAYEIGRTFCFPVITHSTKAVERKSWLDGFREGIYPVLVASRVLNEGVDVPEASIGIVVSGSGSVREHVQRLGRILRGRPGKQAILYELVNSGTAEVYAMKRRRGHSAYRGKTRS